LLAGCGTRSEGDVIIDSARDPAVVLALDPFKVVCSHPDVDALPQDLFADEPRDASVPPAALVESPGQEEDIPSPALDADDRREPHLFPHHSNILASRHGITSAAPAFAEPSEAETSPTGIAWTALTAVLMSALAYGKARTGAAMGNPVLSTEGRVTLIDAALAAAVLTGLVLSAAAGWWWADPLAGYVLVYYAAAEARTILTGQH
jgi:hypothetical protein